MSSHQSYADVLIPQRVDQAYTYIIPEGLPVAEGSFVEVPVRNKLVTGVVWKIQDELKDATYALKPIACVHDTPVMPAPLRGLIDFTAQYCVAPKGNVLKMAMSVPEVFETLNEREGLAVSQAIDFTKLTDKRRQVVEILTKAEQPPTVAELSVMAEVSSSTIRAMQKDGLLVLVPIPVQAPTWAYQAVELSEEQKHAANILGKAVEKKEYAAFLLDGVTGSGKTEVYLDAVAKTLHSGRQALVMLPEISLSSQSIKRFTDRFGAPPVVWHSDITAAQKRKAWRQIASGEARVVVGARSALFLPYPDLGLIVVDEEHETSYKQEEGVIYNARDMAVVRAHLGKCPVVLASATPCLESLDNAVQGKYTWLKLRNRHASATLPDIYLIDMRKQGIEPGQPKRWISTTLEEAIRQGLDNGQQALVYLNRRGYAPLTMCGSCGERINCPHCTAWLVEHKKHGHLMCHHCGYLQRKPEVCPKCQEKALIACGPGVERVAEELQKLFPTYRTEVMASDIMTSVHKLESLLSDLRDGKIHIIVGTQMIAKGHHFPKITVVGVVDADLGLSGGDLRAGERTYQLLNQVAGRAGRERLAGNVYLQTYMPHHPVLQALVSGDREQFLAMETEGRKLNELPPYGRMASLIISSRDKGQVEAYVRQLARAMPQENGVQILGPAPAALAVVRNWHRWRFLIRGSKDLRLQPLIRRWLSGVSSAPAHLRVQVDIDPYNFL